MFQLEKSLGDCDLVDTVKTVICSDPCRCLLQRSDKRRGGCGTCSVLDNCRGEGEGSITKRSTRCLH